jgi:hypothetical protein
MKSIAIYLQNKKEIHTYTMRAACPVLKISMLVRFEVLTAEMMKM